MTVNLGGERGGWSVPRYQASHQEDGNQVREGKVTTVYSYYRLIFHDSLRIIIRKIFFFFEISNLHFHSG